MNETLLSVLTGALDKILIGIAIGLILGVLWGIHRVLLNIWSTLMDIERNTRNKDKGI
jgi:ABC-type nitrate/sulfonate/bicarbonate transport system permease component